MTCDGKFWLITMFQPRSEVHEIINASPNGNGNLEHDLERIMVSKNHTAKFTSYIQGDPIYLR